MVSRSNYFLGWFFKGIILKICKKTYEQTEHPFLHWQARQTVEKCLDRHVDLLLPRVITQSVICLERV
jgi:hypothetical protein